MSITLYLVGPDWRRLRRPCVRLRLRRLDSGEFDKAGGQAIGIGFIAGALVERIVDEAIDALNAAPSRYLTRGPAEG